MQAYTAHLTAEVVVVEDPNNLVEVVVEDLNNLVEVVVVEDSNVSTLLTAGRITAILIRRAGCFGR